MKKPDLFILSKKQLKQYRNLVGIPPKGQIVVEDYHRWITDGKGGITLTNTDKYKKVGDK